MVFPRVLKLSLSYCHIFRHKHSRVKMPPPDRWGDYTDVGSVIEGTRLFCCKVPLKHTLVRALPEEDRFTPESLISKVWKMKQGLGLVVDLTFTRKYYNSSEFTDKGVEYEKIFTKGHDVPTDKVYGRFAHILDTYIERNKCNPSVIGVHCTHGVNRTGYLVCRYLIERHSMEPDEAINAFNTARGHDLERENYLHDLRNREPGTETEYDPSAPMSDEENGGRRGGNAGPSSWFQFPESSRQVENSYSRLMEQHQPMWNQQQERDFQMRDRRGLWSNRESNSSNWRQRNEQNYGGYSNQQNFGGLGNMPGQYDGGPSGQFGGPRDSFGGGFSGDQHGNFRGSRGPRVNFDNSRGGRGSGFDPSYNSMYNGNTRQSSRLRHDSSDGYSPRGGSRPNQGRSFGNGNNQQDFSDDVRSPGGSRQKFEGQQYRGQRDQNYDNVESGSWEDVDPYQYQSPMRYADWSTESDQYANSGWSSRGRGRGSERGRGRGRSSPRRQNRGGRGRGRGR